MSTDRLSDSEMRADSEGSYLAAIEQMRMGGLPLQPTAPIPQATRLVITDEPGVGITATLYDESGPLAAITLGPADACRKAADLLAPACVRMGRPTEGTEA